MGRRNAELEWFALVSNVVSKSLKDSAYEESLAGQLAQAAQAAEAAAGSSASQAAGGAAAAGKGGAKGKGKGKAKPATASSQTISRMISREQAARLMQFAPPTQLNAPRKDKSPLVKHMLSKYVSPPLSRPFRGLADGPN